MNNGKLFLFVALLAFSLLGGIAGDLIFRNYIYTAYDVPLLGDIDYSNEIFRGTNLVIRDAKRVIVEQDEKVRETINNISASLVGIYKRAETNAQSANYYIEDEYAQGLIITSDGWIMAGLGETVPAASLMKNYFVATMDKKTYDIDKVAVDQLTGAVFIHINARGLPVRNFVKRQEISVGDTIIASKWDKISVITQITDADSSEGPNKDSDNGIRAFELKDSGKVLEDFFMFDFSGNYIGYIGPDGDIQSIDGMQSVIASLLKDGEIKRASLGITFLPAEMLINYPYKSGLLVKSVDADSPAFRAGIKEGQIITAADGIQLSASYDLADVVNERLPGDKVVLSYINKEQVQNVSLTLGELKLPDKNND